MQLQTNAVRCAEPGFARALADAGLEQAFVSLHAARASTSDALTAAPGTFEKTLAGVDALLAAGVRVTTNFVVTGENHAELPELASRIAERWRGAPLGVNLSFVHASTDLVPRDARMIPRLRDVRPSIAAALAVLREAGIAYFGFDGQCGVPLCMLGPDWYDVAALAPLPSPEPPPGFVKTEACDRCELTDRCVGLRDTYAALHGTGELSPRLA